MLASVTNSTKTDQFLNEPWPEAFKPCGCEHIKRRGVRTESKECAHGLRTEPIARCRTVAIRASLNRKGCAGSNGCKTIRWGDDYPGNPIE